ncbi:RICIN domain-containing protein [Kitasatospora sp. NBC_00374]|uniref:RICIN domain-containing protein n=1 Tax=Kitasatospora sp. NBC_00374 TaxID=2975964 RepID=UPI0030E5BBD5
MNGGSAADGATVVQNSCGTDPSQQWKLRSTGTYRTVVSQLGGKRLDVADRSTGRGAELLVWACSGGDNQQWARTTA